MNVLVIGGKGFYGKKVVEAIASLPSINVAVASRSAISPDIRVDVCRPETFHQVEAFAIVVNCSDSVAAPPDRLMEYCLLRGIDFFDMGAAAETAQRLLAMKLSKPTGLAVIGVGIFPGVSTLLAHHVFQENPQLDSIEIAIRLSPLSGAGIGNCRLMTEMLTIPSHSIKQHELLYDRPLGASAVFQFQDAGKQIANQVSLPDTQLVYRSSNIPSVATYMAISPQILRHNFALLCRLYRWMGPCKKLYLWLVHQSLWLIRSILLHNTSSSIQFSVVANRGKENQLVRKLTIQDGQLGTAVGVASALALWTGKSSLAPGVYGVSEVFEWSCFARSWAEISGENLLVE